MSPCFQSPSSVSPNPSNHGSSAPTVSPRRSQLSRCTAYNSPSSPWSTEPPTRSSQASQVCIDSPAQVMYWRSIGDVPGIVGWSGDGDAVVCFCCCCPPVPSLSFDHSRASPAPTSSSTTAQGA